MSKASQESSVGYIPSPLIDDDGEDTDGDDDEDVGVESIPVPYYHLFEQIALF